MKKNDDEDFDIEPSKEERKSEKSALIGALLSKNPAINRAFDDLKNNIKAPVKKSALKLKKRRHGRPHGGKVHIEQVRIDSLPEYGRVSEFARCLGIRDASLLQWVELKENPLPFIDDTVSGHKVFRRDIVIAWLESTGRYKRKPEYAEAGEKDAQKPAR